MEQQKKKSNGLKKETMTMTFTFTDRQSEDDEYDKLIDRTYRKANRNTSLQNNR